MVSAKARRPAPDDPSTYSVVELPISQLVKAIPELKGLEPASSQDRLNALLEKTGQNVADFFKLFPNTTSEEFVREQRFRNDGSVDETIAEQFRYLALAPSGESGATLQEYRTNEKGGPIERKHMRGAQMLTQGFVSSANVFLPAYQSASRFRYLGREMLEGRNTEVLAFAEESGQQFPTEKVRAGGEELSIAVQGIAWIDADSGQTLLLRTDLLHPYRQIRLDRQTTQVESEEVHFKQMSSPLWLPGRVVVTVVWDGQLFRNIHTYTNYQLFNVETRETTRSPK